MNLSVLTNRQKFCIRLPKWVFAKVDNRLKVTSFGDPQHQETTENLEAPFCLPKCPCVFVAFPWSFPPHKKNFHDPWRRDYCRKPQETLEYEAGVALECSNESRVIAKEAISLRTHWYTKCPLIDKKKYTNYLHGIFCRWHSQLNFKHLSSSFLPLISQKHVLIVILAR